MILIEFINCNFKLATIFTSTEFPILFDFVKIQGLVNLLSILIPLHVLRYIVSNLTM